MSQKRFALSIKVVIRDAEGRCLLLRRSSQSKGNPGKWEFPGGKVENGESFDIALSREVEEETGLRVSLQRVVGAADVELPDRHVAYLFLEGLLRGGRLRLSSEHEGHAWVALQDLPSMDLAGQYVRFAQEYTRSGNLCLCGGGAG
jgi:8-oxo-dGTP diphosphatase